MANVKGLEFQIKCIFSCILTLFIILIKSLTTKANSSHVNMAFRKGIFEFVALEITSTTVSLKVFRGLRGVHVTPVPAKIPKASVYENMQWKNM